ncbi:MAG TPA: hypothetical protein DD388_09760, partial [Acidimicrobiaceae bacterium]|nr:hypothetical protein [Acidimicrobiaceae bacterium]
HQEERRHGRAVPVRGHRASEALGGGRAQVVLRRWVDGNPEMRIRCDDLRWVILSSVDFDS